LLFDGECGLCQRIVRLLLRLDRHRRLRFAPLQGAAAQEYLRRHGLPTVDFNTLVFVPDWSQREAAGHLLRTDGVIAALRTSGGGVTGALANVLEVLPARVRDAGYRLVARWRFRIFGPWRPRPSPRPEWQHRFLR
jgi:predicted DCC family thiol-disulfide oxidoreductase YuxK